MTRHPALGHPPLSRPPTSLLKRLACALTLLSASAQAAVVTATWNAASDTPVTASSYTATGNTVSFALNFTPQTRMDLMVVKNTGLPFIQGRFSNLAQGQAVALSFGGTTYNYVANYYGGSGNDLVLQSADVVLAAWGNNGNGQLGNGSLTQSLLPVAVTSTGVLAGKTVISVAAGNSHSLALCSDGTVAAWGSNYYGELGNGNTGLSYSSVPVAVTRTGVLAGKTVISVAAGSDHSLALCSDGTVAAWGWNFYGQLGNGNTTNSSVPVTVASTGVLAGKTVISFAAGVNRSLAVCSDGTVAAWGFNGSGQLGNGTAGTGTDSSVPVAVTSTGVLAGKTVISVAPGYSHSLALCSDGTVAAWGSNSYGGLGNGNTGLSHSSVPVAVTRTGVLAGKAVISVAGGWEHSLALCSDGTVAAWGYNGYGQLGNGNTTNILVPVAVTSTGVLAGKTVISVAAWREHSLALCSDGTMAAWGRNFYGQLGNGNTSDSSVPVAASANSSYFATRAVGGAYHNLSLGSFVPIVATLAATQVGTTLNCTVNANGYSSAVSFDYGLTTSYGSAVAGTPSPVTGSTPTAVSAVPPGLTPSTTYHFRVKAVSSGGTSVGSDLTFTTPSNNANLAGLALSTGTLAPTFASGTLSYAASVPNATTNLTVTPTTADAGATVKVNGTSVASGSASGSISLAVGNNTLNTVVTAADGTTTKTYTISVTRLPLPPTVSSPTITAVTTNSATLGGNVTSDGGATVTARGVVLALTAANANPQLGGTGVTNVPGTGTTGVFTVGASTLASGSGYSYTAYATNSAGTSYSSTGTFTTVSTDANLAGLALSSGTLAPTFASGTTGYTVSVPNATTSLIVTPTAADTGATVKVNGTSVASGSASGAISLGVGGDTLTILVTAADGTTIKTYTIVVTRPPTVTSPTSTEVTTNSATLGGNVTGDGGAAVTARGVVLALTAANANPQLGGTGVTNVSGTGTTGVFTVGAGPLTPSSSYSYAAYATNNLGTSYSSTGTFTTASITDASLAGLALSAGTLAPSFASATIGYTASVPNTITSLMVTPTVSVFGATVKVNGTSVASGSASAAISLAVGTNTISTVVTAADGTTTKTYILTVTRRAVVAVLATYSAATDVPVVASGYDATGNTVSFALNFAPQTQMDFMVVNNTGLPFIEGRFSNLAQGQAVALSYAGKTYNYVANYYGSSGNDLVLHSADVVLVTSGSLDRVAGKTVIAVDAGNDHSLALCSDGTVAAWGGNYFGQLGNGNTTDSSVPVAVMSTGVLAGKTVISVAAGNGNSLALCSDGTVAAWGRNFEGQLGNGNNANSPEPVAVTRTGVLAGKTVIAVDAGADHSLALCSDGTVVAWGYNGYGQLGNGDKTGSWVPVAVTSTGVLAGKTVISVAAGSSHSLALCSDGTVAAWGYNGSGRLGNGNTTDSSVPVAVTRTSVLAGKTVISVAAGNRHSLALCSDGTVAAWGNNGYGQLGNGSNTTDSWVPVAVTSTGVLAGKTVISAAAGGLLSLALCSDGTVAAWGYDGNGMFGYVDTVLTLPVSTLFRGTRLAGGGSQALVLGNAPPSVASMEATAITLKSATLGGDVRSDGGFTITERGVVYAATATNGDPLIGGGGVTQVRTTGTTGVFSAAVTGLTQGTEYSYKAYATNSLGTSHSVVGTFTAVLGTLDTSFNPNADNEVSSLAVQADGKVLIGGDFTTVGGVARNYVARLNADGSLDTGFNPNANSTVTSLAVQADGKVLIGGYFTSVGGVARNYVARLNADGSLDTGFNPNVSNLVRSLVVQADGKVLIGGWFDAVGGVARNFVARLNANGTLDTSFNPNADFGVISLAVQADGKVLLGGDFTTVGGVVRNRIARVNADGTLDTSFNPNANGGVRSVAVQADGKVLLGGDFTTAGGVARNDVARLNANGTLDTGFNPDVNGTYVSSLAVQADGKVLIGGSFITVGGVDRNGIARLNADGTLDTSFNSNMNGTVYNVAVQADGYVLLGGGMGLVRLISEVNPWASFELKGHGTAAPSYVNVIFQLKDIYGKELNLPREIIDQNNDMFAVTENGIAVSPSESFLQIAKKDEVPAKVRTILLLNNSFSVGANLAAIKGAAKGLVDSMFDQQEVAVYSFSGSYTLVKDFTGKSPANQQALKTAIDSIGLGSSSTDLYRSLLAMLNLPQWQESFTLAGIETGSLVVLTAGSDSPGELTLAEVLTKRDTDKKRIYTVGLGAAADAAALTSLGNAGYYPAAQAGDLAAAFGKIQSSILNNANSYYWLNYASLKRGNFNRTLTVSLKNNGNDGTNSTLTDTFNSTGFTDVTASAIINRSVTANSGVSSLSIKNGESSIARAFTMLPPFGTPAYTWTLGNTAAATLTPIGSDGSRVTITPTTSNIATTLTLTDTVNGYAKTIPLLIGTSVQLTPQSITFAKPADRPFTSAAFTLSPVPTASPSGLPVSLAILSGPATIVGNTVTLTGTVGTVVIRATQAGNATYAAATPVDVSFAVTSAAVVPIVSNLTAVQRAGTKLVDIRYDLAAPGLSTVALQASSDGGATWSVRVASVSGAIGSSVAPGTGMTLVWNAGTDWPQSYSTQMRFRVTTNDGVLASLTSSAETGNVTVDTRVVPTIPSPTVAGIAQQAYVKASNTGVDDLFGHAVAISGNTLVVGAPFESSAATGINGDQANDTARRAGAVYVYIRTGSTWTQQAYLKASNTNAGDEFGSAVAIDGDTIVVGARGEASNSAGVNGNQADNSLDSAGAAYIFTRTGTTWTQQAYLKAGNGPSASDRFGGAVAVSGNTVVIGGGDGSGTGVEESGAAYVFNRTGSTWSQQAYLKASNMGFGDRFGQSVGISGNTLIVGAPGEDGAGQGIDPASNEGMTDSGAAYVFTRSGTTWTEQSYIKAFNTGSGHLFGESVAISGDTAVIGAPIENGANIGIDSLPVVRSLRFGAAYVFERSDAAWAQTSYLKRCNPRGNYYAPVFGCDVAISGSTIVVGERQECGSGTGINPPFDEASMFTGAAYVFVRNGNVWDKQAYLKASNTSSGDFFGSAVAVSDGSVVVGAANEDGGGSGVNPVSDELGLDAGAAYVYTGAGALDPLAPSINKPVIPEATRNVYISIPVQITGGGVLTCRVVSGTLPPGVTLNATTGAVSGTPTVAGNYAFTVRATNAYGSADVPLVINVAAGDADLAPPSMRPGTVLDYEGTLDDSLDGTESDSGELIFLTTTKFEGGSYAYTKTGPNTATVTYTLSYAEPGSSETNNGTMLATFDSPTSGSYTVTGRSNGKKGSTPFNSTFSGSGTFSFTAVPDIAVAFNGQSLASGEQVDFGKIGVGSGLAERSFTISNTSSADLTGLDITIDGPNASSFSVTTPPVSPVAQGGSTTFTVQSTVGSAGLQTATLNIASNDEADASYTIKLKATGLASAPTLATTVAAAGITFEGATLKATVNANNSEQAIAFDYGLTTSYGSTIEAFPATATGSNLIAVQYPVNGLLPHTKYFFRVKATGNAGTVYGSALSFTTLNRAPSIVGDDAAALPGEVLTLDALSNDVDEDGDALSMISVGSVSVSAGSAKLIAGKIVFTAAATFAGTPLAYTIADSLGARTTRQITIALAPCDLSPAAVSLPPAADSYTVGVATDNAWKVTENLPWASVSPTSGTGPGNVTVTLQENTAKASRSGVMMIGGHAHTITQSGSGGLTIEVPASIPEGMVSADYTLTIPALLPPVKFTATGLPTGLGINATSGEITGKPSAAGRFSASITGTTSAGASTKIVVPLVIQALPTGTIGSFTGLVSQDALSAGLGGSFALNVTSTGSYTGSLNLGLATHKFTGRVVAAVGENPTISLAIPRPSPAPSLTLALTFDGSNNALTGEVGDGTQPPATIDGRRSIWAGTSASDYAALYNTVAELPASDPDQPEGAAWEQMTVTAAGATTGTGRTADGIAYTFSGPLWPDGSQPHFVLIYNKHGSVIGLPTISLGTDLADNRVTGWIDQIKTGPTATTDRTYSAGLAYTRRNLDGSPWIKPTTTLPIVLDLADEAGNASIAFSGGGVEAENQFDSLAQTFRVNKNNSTTFPAATVLAGNPCKVSMAITPATGFFSGSFTLSDIVAGRTITRAISYAGILQSHTSQGHGYFLLPGLSPSATTSPITGGRVLVTK